MLKKARELLTAANQFPAVVKIVDGERRQERGNEAAREE